MIFLKHMAHSYVNKKDNTVYTVSCDLYVDEDQFVEWIEDKGTGHYFPKGFDLNQFDAQKHQENQAKKDKETGVKANEETHAAQVAQAQEKSAENLAKDEAPAHA